MQNEFSSINRVFLHTKESEDRTIANCLKESESITTQIIHMLVKLVE